MLSQHAVDVISYLCHRLIAALQCYLHSLLLLRCLLSTRHCFIVFDACTSLQYSCIEINTAIWRNDLTKLGWLCYTQSIIGFRMLVLCLVYNTHNTKNGHEFSNIKALSVNWYCQLVFYGSEGKDIRLREKVVFFLYHRLQPVRAGGSSYT